MKKMTLEDHLVELRYRVILALIGVAAGLTVCLVYGGYFLEFISVPYRLAMAQNASRLSLQAIEPAESFLVYVKTSLLAGIILSSPWIFYHLWAFVATGLYACEKRVVYVVTPVCAILFIAGSLFFIMVIAPIVMQFFVNFDPGIDFVKPEFSFKYYVDFILTLTFVFGLAFELPVVIVLLYLLGIVSVAALSRARKYIILLIVIASAIMTPPDVVSQLALALPLYILFEASVLVCRILPERPGSVPAG